MKIVNQILKFILILGSLSYFRINAKAAVETMVNKKQIPYEILNISIVDNSLVIEGWVFISYKQHYLNEQDHKTELEFFSLNDSFRIQAKLTNVSLTNQMEYFGSPKCALVAIGQAPELCNYNYENVGFIATIPLSKFKLDTTYQTNIISYALKSNLIFKTPVYFPIPQDLNFNFENKQYKISSRLNDTEIKVNSTTVIARKQPSKVSTYWYSGSNCSTSYKNQLFFLVNSIYKNVTSKVFSDYTSFYSVSAKLSVCDGPRRRIVEGTELQPIWISSLYVVYSGTPLQISSNLVNQAPYFEKNDITVYEGESFNLNEHVKAFDFEEGDISHKIHIISSNYEDKIGTYQIDLSVKDSQGLSAYTTMFVSVLALPNENPVIFAENIKILKNTEFNPLTYISAFDSEDGDISNAIVILNEIDTSTIGIFEQCYYVEDSNQLSATKCINVEIYTNDYLYNKFRMISENNLFYKESIPLNWKDIIYIIENILFID
jgi:hypothetical protein